MAKDTESQRATLASLATHLHGTSIATRVRDDGLVAEFRAIGHSFRFHINPGGEVVERACVADHIGVLSRDELNILCSLTAAELGAGLAVLAMTSREDDLLDRVAKLTSIQSKLAVAVETGQFLSEDDRRVLAQALADYCAGIHEGNQDTDIESSLSLHIEAIERKLSI